MLPSISRLLSHSRIVMANTLDHRCVDHFARIGFTNGGPPGNGSWGKILAVAAWLLKTAIALKSAIPRVSKIPAEPQPKEF
jgi:hypothetical protein